MEYDLNNKKPSALLYGELNEVCQTVMKAHIYSKNGYKCKTIYDIKDVEVKTDQLIWIQVIGLADTEKITQLCKNFGVHSLVLEDIINTNQRIKQQPYEGYTHITTRTLQYNFDSLKLSGQQISIIRGQHFLLSFEELSEEYLSQVNQKLSNIYNAQINYTCEFLCYCMLDLIVDDYYSVIELFTIEVENSEINPIQNKSIPEELRRIQLLKGQNMRIHRIIRPMRDIINEFVSNDRLMKDTHLKAYTNDLYDNIIQIIEQTDILRETLAGSLEIYLSLNSNKMNEIMKVLAMISTVFIPLTFIAGVYGMNLQMPEFSWRFSYPVVLAIMFIAAIGMLIYFKRKKWF